MVEQPRFVLHGQWRLQFGNPAPPPSPAPPPPLKKTTEVSNAKVSTEQPRSVLRGHGNGLGSSAPDVYSVTFHSGEAHVITAGHDRTVRLYDIESGQVRPALLFAAHRGFDLFVWLNGWFVGWSIGRLLVRWLVGCLLA